MTELDTLELAPDVVASLPDWSDVVAHLASPRLPRVVDVLRAAEVRGRPAVQPRCGVGGHAPMRHLLRELEDAAPDILSVTIDSHTRLRKFRAAREVLLRDPAELNGYPLVTHGWRRGRQLVGTVGVPLEVRHGSPDPRELFAVSLASGITSFEGGGIGYNLPYSKDVPLSRSLRAWQRVDAVCGTLARDGVVVDRELFGTLTAVLVPPSVSLAMTLLEGVAAVAEGVRCLSISYPQGGEIHQDIAALRATRTLARRYLGPDVEVYPVLHEFMGVFPTTPEFAGGLILLGGLTARLGGATKVITKTVQEAQGIPDAAANASGLRTAALGASDLLDFVRVDEDRVAEEQHWIEREVAELVEPVLAADDLFEGIEQAFRDGRLDIPFSASVHARSEIVPRRDASGSIRYGSSGNLPFSGPVLRRHATLLRAAEGAPPRSRMAAVHDDIHHFLAKEWALFLPPSERRRPPLPDPSRTSFSLPSIEVPMSSTASGSSAPLPAGLPDPEAGARVVADDRAHLFHSWAAQGAVNPMPVAGGEGRYFWDYEGRRYLDFSSQFINLNIGHAHPKVVAAIKDQADRICMIASTFANDRRGEAARLIAEIAPGDLNRVFFTNGGAEANEHAVRMARIHTGRPKVLSAYRSYHGGTATAISLTGDPRRWANENSGSASGNVAHFFGPYLYRSHFHATTEAEECERALAHLEQVITFEGPSTIAAIVLETVVGTAGILVPPPGYLAGVRELCDRYGILYIADEVMSGFGRTGAWFAVDHWGVTPDLITFAKGVNSGYVPLGGVILSDAVHDTFRDVAYPGGLTYSGHPLACAAAVGTIIAMREEGVNENAARVGAEIIGPGLREIAERHPSVGEVRGLGVFWAVELVRDRETREMLVPYAAGGELARPVDEVVAACKEGGMWPVYNYNRIHVVPPCTITDEEAREGLAILDQALYAADKYVG